MGGPWEYHAKWNKSNRKRTMWFHLYVGYKTESNKWINKKNKQKLRHRQQSVGYQREGGSVGIVKGKGVKCIAIKNDLTVGGGHTMQYTDHAS